MKASSFHVSRAELKSLSFGASAPSIETPDPLLGRQVGEYRIMEKLGAGGMGVVYLGVHDLLDRRVAIKVLAEALSRDPDSLARFLREARVTLSLDHPCIRHIHDIRQEGHTYYMVMEYIDGIGLHSLVRSNGPLDPSLAVRIGGKVAKALSYAHRRGIIHRDVKPRNILIGRKGTVKVTDFGLAKVLTESTALTMTGAVLGTPEFMSPEQFEGKPVDLRADLYSLGATLFFLLTGHAPFEAPDLYALMAKHRHDEPPSPRKFNPRVPVPLCAVVFKLLEKSPNDRFADCDLLLAALADVLSPAAAAIEVPTKERHWVEEERYNEGVQIQKEFELAGLAAPPIGEVQARMERLREVRSAPDEDSSARMPSRCTRCAWTGPPGALVCMDCQSPATNHRLLAYERDLCLLETRLLSRPKDDLAWEEVSRAIEEAFSALSGFPLIDLSLVQRFGKEDAAHLMALGERLTRRGRPFFLILGSPAARELAEGLGLGQFMRTFPDQDAFRSAFDAGRLCPHAARWLGEAKGFAAYGPASHPAVEAIVEPCVDRGVFDDVIERFRGAVASEDALALRDVTDMRKGTLAAPCCEAVLAFYHRVAREKVFLALCSRGTGLLGQHKHAEAAEVFTRLIAAFPEAVSAHHYRGLAHLGAGRLDEAVSDFLAALARAENVGPYSYSLATAYRRQGRLEDAMRAYDAAVAAQPDLAAALADRGALKLQVGDLEGALADFDRAVAAEPRNAAYLNNRGKVKHHLGRLDEALADFEAALAVDPDDALALNNVGALAARTGDFSRARKALKRALRLTPKAWRPYYNLACISARTGAAEEALSLLREAVARGLRRPELIRHNPDLAAVVALENYARWEREVFEHPPEPSAPPLRDEDQPSTCSTVMK